MARIRPLVSESSEILYEKIRVKTKIKNINAMLRALKKADYYDESIAVENLFNYLDSTTVDVSMTQRGYVSTREIKDKTMTQLTGINKALSDFVRNQTSTVKGMDKLYDDRINELRKFIDDEDFVNSLTYHDVKVIYGFFNAKEYERNEKRFPSKDMYVLFTKTLSEKWSSERFMVEIQKYIDVGNDDDLKDDLMTLYNNYLKPYANRK